MRDAMHEAMPAAYAGSRAPDDALYVRTYGTDGLTDVVVPSDDIFPVRYAQDAKPSAAARGLDHKHQAERERLLPDAIGQPCPLCGYEMRIGQALDLDHVIPRSKGGADGPTRITHAECNRARRDGDLFGRRPKGPKDIRKCEICGQAYWPGYSRQRTCGRACGVELQRRNRPLAQPRVKPEPVLIERTCTECESAFETSYQHKLTCSKACSRERLGRRARERYTPIPQALRVVRTYPVAVCKECGDAYPPNSGHQRYCSERCSKRRRGREQKARARVRRREQG